jgi:hypothetical protein
MPRNVGDRAGPHLLPLRIRVLSATGAGGIVEQRKAYPSTLLDKFEEALLDQVTMNRHLADVVGLR